MHNYLMLYSFLHPEKKVTLFSCDVTNVYPYEWEQKKKKELIDMRIIFYQEVSEETFNATESMVRAEDVIDAYYPVLEQIESVQKWYNGGLDGTPKICPDITADLISKFIKARQSFNIIRKVAK